MHLPPVSTRGQAGLAGCLDVSDGADLQVAGPGERGPPLLFTTVAFDQLLFSPWPAEGQTGAEIPLGQASLLLALFPSPRAGQTVARSLGKHSLASRSVCRALQSSFLHSTSHDPLMTLECKQSRWDHTLGSR